MNIPTGVLSQRLGDIVAGRRVRAAVFTTFSFDPGFFELQVLPNLFEHPFRQADKLERIQLEEALGDVESLAVYYDQRALARDAEPAQLDYRRIDVRRATGCFHPKLVLLLVEEPRPDDHPSDDPWHYESLVVGILSANLTRAGWWENVECAHFEEIHDRDLAPRRIAFRRDLLSLLRRVQHATAPDEDHTALERIRKFLRTRTARREFHTARAGGHYRTRIFCGQEPLADWLHEHRLHRHRWNLEIISPYFPKSGAGPLEDLIDTLAPREVRVHLPTTPDGAADITATTYTAVQQAGARWAALPGDLVSRSKGLGTGPQPPRTVHAKVYRFWHRDHGDVLLVGSVNLTRPGHGHAREGNLEAAFLIDVSDAGLPRRWWLQPLERDVEAFADNTPDENEGATTTGRDLSLRFDWATHTLSYRLRDQPASDLVVSETSGRVLFTLHAQPGDAWTPCPPDHSQAVQDLLASTSFVHLRTDTASWRVLIREENCAHRPSLLTKLTPEEILEYWALLTPEQRAAFLERQIDADLEGLGLVDRTRPLRGNTLFDRFTGIFHAFGCLRRHVAQAVEEGRCHEAESRMFGAKYDSLPNLLEKELAQPEHRDPVTRYVTFLSAQQLRDAVATDHADFTADCGPRTAHLDALLARLPEVRRAIPAQDGGDAFLTWYEAEFLRDLAPTPRGPR